MDYGMTDIFLVLLVFALPIVAAVICAISKKKRDAAIVEDSKREELKFSKSYRKSYDPGQKPIETEKETSKKGAQSSLDELYARENGLWICRYCETINQNSDERCAACGARKT